MKNHNYHQRSYQTVSSAVAELSHQFENICIPLRNNFYYDLIGEKDFKIYRIKVIFTNHKQYNGNYIACIRKNGRLNLNFDKKYCDFLYIECPSGKYLIPSSEIFNHLAVTLNQFESFRIVDSLHKKPD